MREVPPHLGGTCRDAGYLYAEGGKLCCGTPSRSRSVLQPALAVELLMQVAREATQLSVLRTYWYDAARDGIRTQKQREVAALANVKLRLGRLNSNNQQKGVDALIYRDLITLAQHRAISDAVLLSGDEDLREGVRAAQDSVRAAAAAFAWDWLNAAIEAELADLPADHAFRGPWTWNSSPPSSRPSVGRCLTTTRGAVMHGRRSGV